MENSLVVENRKYLIVQGLIHGRIDDVYESQLQVPDGNPKFRDWGHFITVVKKQWFILHEAFGLINSSP